MIYAQGYIWTKNHKHLTTDLGVVEEIWLHTFMASMFLILQNIVSC